MKTSFPPKVIITGGSGLLGSNAALSLKDIADVALLTNTNTIQINGVKSFNIPLNIESFTAFCVQFKPNVIIHSAGYTNVNKCEINPDKAYHANCHLAETVAQVAASLNVQLVHISTDHLFGEGEECYDESDNPTPLNQYAETKLQAEKKVLKHCPNALVVRTNFFGWGILKGSITDWVIATLRSGKPLHGFDDVYFTPILIEDLIYAIYDCLDKGLSDVINIVGDQALSKYDFALKVAQVFDLDENLVKPISYHSMEFDVDRPLNMSLSNRKVKMITGKSFNLDDGLKRLKEQESMGWPKVLANAYSI